MRKKVTVVGAGNVGANCALRIADKELADVVFMDEREGVQEARPLGLTVTGTLGSWTVPPNVDRANWPFRPPRRR